MFMVSRDGKFSNMLRNDLKVEFKKGSSFLAYILSFLASLILRYWRQNKTIAAILTYLCFVHHVSAGCVSYGGPIHRAVTWWMKRKYASITAMVLFCL